MIDEQFLQTIPQFGIGGFVGKVFKKVKDTVKKVAPIVGGGIGFLIGGSAGAGIGAGIGGLIAGQKPGEALGTAALGYGIGSLAGSFAPIGRYAGRGIPGTNIGGLLGGAEDRLLTTATDDPANIIQRLIGGGGTPKISPSEQKIINFQSAIDAGEIDSKLGNELIQLEKLKILTGKDKTPILGGNLGNVLTAGAAISPIATYLAAQAEQEGFVPEDPNALNPFYYMNPEEFQVAGIGTRPIYFDTLQDDFGVPREDLPTDFVRPGRGNPALADNRLFPMTAAKGGIMRLANGGTQEFPRKTGEINGPGTGTSDDIPAMLSDGEFVFTAKAVRNAGGGSRREGAKRMYQMMKNLEKGGTLSEQSRGVA
jgi:hypothetical protein